ncbi:protein of unknown function [Brochothrix thermosphacta]|uniref:hypothetical protein n=1 Tax=Brochothrix thermosphacta TaxID=2756 RepID=UPI000D777EED|nr:hypothetical protein [Brochothrix thermosphacta]SPN71910.1 protein of unknown function [Brochothrix thermosphacta]
MTQLHVLQSVYEDIKSRIQQRGHDVQVTFPIEEYQYPFILYSPVMIMLKSVKIF